MTLRGVPILGHELSREVSHPRAWGEGFESPPRLDARTFSLGEL
jgi:hypothetical protein